MVAKNPAAEWVEQLDELLGQIKGWSESEGWLVNEQEAARREPKLGEYHTQQLTIQSPKGRLIIDPIAKSIVDADGRVDLFAWPSMNRLMILRTGRGWKLRTDSGVDWPKPWGKRTFLQVAQALLSSQTP